MGFAVKAYRRMLIQLVLIQLALISLSVVVALLYKDAIFSIALFYGGFIVTLGTLVSGWRFLLMTNPSSGLLGMTELYKGTVFRFVLVIALLAIGMGALKLDPLAVVIGFCLTQASYFFGPRIGRWGRQ
ncbi:MAG: ATP synthase subunit I [Gammaproteobacteria bacterium]|nr:ATP synthase subunit I [Gammaproteobacteria bacterium]